MRKYLLFAVLASVGMVAQAQVHEEVTQGQKIGSQSEIVNTKIIVEPPKPKKIRKPRKFKWNVKAGYSIDQYTGLSDQLGSTHGYDAGFGVVFPIGDKGLFWSAEATGISYGAKIKRMNKTMHAWGFSVSPTIGYKIPISGNFAIAPYVGPYVGIAWGEYRYSDYDYTYYKDGVGYPSYTYNYDYKIANGFRLFLKNTIPDVGVNIGFSLFLSKGFYIDVHCKKGFMKSEYEIDDYSSVYREWGEYNGEYQYYPGNIDIIPSDYRFKKNLNTLKIVFGLGYQF